MEYRLEITMEAKAMFRLHKYIKRSFPVKVGLLDIGKYGYPYNRYKSIEVLEIAEDETDTRLRLRFDGEEVDIYLNGFSTLKREYEITDNEANVSYIEVVHSTFHLFVD